MTKQDIKKLVAEFLGTFGFLLPNSDFVPVHAHVTEVARIDKRFVDCSQGKTIPSFHPLSAPPG